MPVRRSLELANEASEIVVPLQPNPFDFFERIGYSLDHQDNISYVLDGLGRRVAAIRTGYDRENPTHTDIPLLISWTMSAHRIARIEFYDSRLQELYRNCHVRLIRAHAPADENDLISFFMDRDYSVEHSHSEGSFTIRAQRRFGRSSEVGRAVAIVYDRHTLGPYLEKIPDFLVQFHDEALALEFRRGFPDYVGRRSGWWTNPWARGMVPSRTVDEGNVVSVRNDPSQLFRLLGYLIERRGSVQFVTRAQGGTEPFAEFSRNSLGIFVIRFHDMDLMARFKSRMFLNRLLE
jgi:hypothetical protein